jgi:hypothetical protein
MTRSLVRMCLFAALPLLAPLAGLTAQQQPAVPPAPADASQPESERKPSRASAPAQQFLTVTMAFPGGTFGDFCAHIRAREPKANIVLAAVAAEATLPPMDLRGAGLDQALEGACLVAASSHHIAMKNIRGNGESVYTIIAHAPPKSPETTDATRPEGTEVFSLNRITDDRDTSIGKEPATVLSAIEAAVGAQGGALGSLLWHKESGLVIVRGTGPQLAIVGDVLRNLERDVDARRREAHARKGIAPQPAAEDPRK